jgi:protoheme IX farnesyltransferase
MLPVRDESGVLVARWSFGNTIALVVVSLLPVYLGLASTLYLCAAVVGGVWFLWRAAQFLRASTRDAAARKLFFTSIGYLPLVLTALVIDRIFFPR